MHYFISAGEASGDLHAAQLIRALREADSSGARFTFLGGDLMAAEAGCEPLIHYERMAFMGFSEVLRNLDKVTANLRTAKRALAEGKPDALILVDYPSFNLKLAKEAARYGIPVFYYISPKVWAWKEGRVKAMRKYVRRIFSILPFEPEWYARRHGMEVTYVGNPTVGEVAQRLKALPRHGDFCAAHGLDPEKPILALVPGSRRGEIRCNLPVMLEVARRHPELQAVIAAAPGIRDEAYAAAGAGDVPRVAGSTFELMAQADSALVTSGTATLEAALIGTPQVVCYRSNGSRLAYNIMKHILKCPYVSLPNLIAGEEVVSEKLVHLCTADSVDAALREVGPGSEGRRRQTRGYGLVHRRLTDADAATAAAAAILAELSQR